jgi:hypothetical protein
LQKAGVLMGNYYLAIGFVVTLLWLALVFPLTKSDHSGDADDSESAE